MLSLHFSLDNICSAWFEMRVFPWFLQASQAFLFKMTCLKTLWFPSSFSLMSKSLWDSVTSLRAAKQQFQPVLNFASGLYIVIAPCEMNGCSSTE